MLVTTIQLQRDSTKHMDQEIRKIHIEQLLIMPENIEQNLKKFKTWMELKYKASEIYDELAAQHVWEEVMEKFNELFGK